MVRATSRRSTSTKKQSIPPKVEKSVEPSVENKGISTSKRTAKKGSRSSKTTASQASKRSASAHNGKAKTAKASKARKATKGEKVNRFHQLLGRLTVSQAAKLLGEEGNQLLTRGGQKYEIDPQEDVYFGGDLYRVRVKDAALSQASALVSITLFSGRQRRLLVNCNQCETPC